jgi:hypothetical protein
MSDPVQQVYEQAKIKALNELVSVLRQIKDELAAIRSHAASKK